MQVSFWKDSVCNKCANEKEPAEVICTYWHTEVKKSFLNPDINAYSICNCISEIMLLNLLRYLIFTALLFV